MKSAIGLQLLAVTVLLFSLPTGSSAQSLPVQGTVIVPPSSLPHPGFIQTNLVLLVPNKVVMEPGTYPPGENPGSLACIYKLVKETPGCEQGNSNFPTGGGKTLAIVGYGDNADAESDLETFSSAFGLPQANFQKVCVPAGHSCSSEGWEAEESLDIEYAHGMAPKATIYLVELANDDNNIMDAEDAASSLVSQAGGGEVSNSWNFTDGEFAGETGDDSHFATPGIVYLAASGDSRIVEYPSASPNVVSVGGTTIHRNSSGDFIGEIGWSQTGGGPSQYEPRPGYQNVVSEIVGKHRGTPDLSSDADLNSGAAVYSQIGCGGWCIAGGTSLATPTMAGIINAAGEFNTSTDGELTEVYNEYEDNTEHSRWFRDIIDGNNGHPCEKSYDMCTGLGSVLTYEGK
jgi:kumamolisin